METIITVFSVEVLQTVYHESLLIGYGIAVACQNHTYRSIVFKLKVDLIQCAIHTGLHHFDDIVLHTGQYHLRLRVAESGIVFQYLGTVFCQHQSEEDDSLERSAFRCHGIHGSLVDVFLTECIHFPGIEGAGRKGSHTTGVQTLITVLRSLMILRGSHDADSLAIYKRKNTDFSAGHELFDDHTVAGCAKLFIQHDLIHACQCFF